MVNHCDNTTNVDSPRGTTATDLDLLTSMAAIAGPAGAESHAHESKEILHNNSEKEDDVDEQEDEEDDKSNGTKEENDNKESKPYKKSSRRELPPHTVSILKGWMLSPQHVKHPYPTDEDKQMLLAKTGINMKQLTNWFTNARKRIWKPMMRREHSRQAQKSLELETRCKSIPRYHDTSNNPMYPPSIMHRSYEGSHVQSYHGYDSNEGGYAMGIPQSHAAYPPLYSRADSEVSSYNANEYMEVMRMRKRALEEQNEVMDRDYNKRYRRSSSMSPRCVKMLQEWVAARAHMEYVTPSDSDKLQISRDTGLDIQQIENWFEANIGPQTTHPSTPHGQVSYPSIPTPNNSMYPPPPCPSHKAPMFPPRPVLTGHSSIPSEQHESVDAYQNGMTGNHYHSGVHQYNNDPRTRSFSINSGHHYIHPVGKREESVSLTPTSVGTTGGLPSLSYRRTTPPAPTMGQPRDGRSHTLDMGVFADARRRSMNFQDILSSTASNAAFAQPHTRVSSNLSGSESFGVANAENVYPNSVSEQSTTHKGFESSHSVPTSQVQYEVDTRTV